MKTRSGMKDEYFEIVQRFNLWLSEKLGNYGNNESLEDKLDDANYSLRLQLLSLYLRFYFVFHQTDLFIKQLNNSRIIRIDGSRRKQSKK